MLSYLFLPFGLAAGCIPVSLPDDTDGFTTTTTAATSDTTTTVVTTTTTAETTTTSPPDCMMVCPSIAFCRSADQSVGNCYIPIYAINKDANDVCTFTQDCTIATFPNNYNWYLIQGGVDTRGPSGNQMDSFTCSSVTGYQWKSDMYGYSPLMQAWCSS